LVPAACFPKARRPTTCIAGSRASRAASVDTHGLRPWRYGVQASPAALRAEREPCQRAGLDFIELGFHQHGLASAGPLTVVHKPGPGSLAGGKVSELKFQENMVFGTNIDIHDPGWKDVGLMLGDTLQVTREGNRCLVNTPLDIIEKMPSS